MLSEPVYIFFIRSQIRRRPWGLRSSNNFSILDILMIPQALGMECVLKAGVGPCFSKPLTCKEDVTSLKPVSSLSNDLECVYEAIRLTRHGLQGKVILKILHSIMF